MAHLSLYYRCRGIGMRLDNAFDCEKSVGNDIAEICEFCAIVVESVMYVS
jgi:hypothetical protein